MSFNIRVGSCILMGIALFNGCLEKSELAPLVTFELNENGVSHLYWPFYNSSYPALIESNVPSGWEHQIEGKNTNSTGTLTTWRYHNDHELEKGLPTHHIYADWFAQDWNYFMEGNSDCGMSFYAPLSGTIIRIDRVCVNAEADCDNPVCDRSSPYIYGNQFYLLVKQHEVNFVFRAAHFVNLNANLTVNQPIEAGHLIGQIGNEGNSSAAHLHASLWKNVSDEELELLILGMIDIPEESNINGATYAADFLFDANVED